MPAATKGKQQRTIDDAADAAPVAENESAREADDAALPAVAEKTPDPPQRTALTDLRSGAMRMPVDQMPVALADYAARRKTLRDWLREQMVEGVHYGYPPGCEPKIEMRNGVPHVGVWFRGKNGQRGEYRWFPESQWTSKHSLYKSGADFVCDLMGIRCEFEADLTAWQQLGSPSGTFVVVCRGVSRETGEVIGEGRGVRKVGQEGGGGNNALRMAQKAAKVDMVRNAYGLSDLFTQDVEDGPAPPDGNPEQRPDAPHAAPRGERVTRDECLQLLERWHNVVGGDQDDFRRWASNVTGLSIEAVSVPNGWTRGALDACHRELTLTEREGAQPPGETPKRDGGIPF